MPEHELNRILVICGHNAGRSQMAEGLINNLVGASPVLAGKWEAISAGTRPGERINPLVVQAMTEIGIGMNPGTHFPKPLDSDFVRERGATIKRVIIACDDTCELPGEIPAGVPVESWRLPDPHQQPLEVVRTVRDLTLNRVQQLLKELGEIS